MEQIKRSALKSEFLPGRIIQKVSGLGSPFQSQKMTMGFATYCAECGPMQPHHHAEELIYVVSSDRGYVRYGDAEDQLGERVPLEAGMTLHFPELEWHVFEYDEGGQVDVIFFYGQIDNIRPEEILNT